MFSEETYSLVVWPPSEKVILTWCVYDGRMQISLRGNEKRPHLASECSMQCNTGLYEMKTSLCCSDMKERDGRMIPAKNTNYPKIV
jgi:hypothetical protein